MQSIDEKTREKIDDSGKENFYLITQAVERAKQESADGDYGSTSSTLRFIQSVVALMIESYDGYHRVEVSNQIVNESDNVFETSEELLREAEPEPPAAAPQSGLYL